MRSRSTAIPAAALALLAAVGLLACSDQGGSGGNGDGAAASTTTVVADPGETIPADPAAFADAMAAAAEGLDDAGAAALVAALPAHREELVTIDRPVVVQAFGALLASSSGDAAVGVLRDWLIDTVGDELAGTTTDEAMRTAITGTLGPAVAAALTDAESIGSALRDISLPALAELSNRITARNGQEPVEPDQYAQTLSEAFATGDPIALFEATVITEQQAYPDPGADWVTG